MLRLFAVLSFLLLAHSAGAQVIPVTSYILRFYQAGAQAPVQQESFGSGSVLCGQAPLPPTLPTVNPTRASWTDPNGTNGQVCIYGEAQGGPLFSLPIGNYEATLTASNDAGSSPESARAVFSRVATLAAPSGFRIVR